MNVSAEKLKGLTQQLLILEANEDEPAHLAVARVCDKLRRPICTLAGVEGYRSLLKRALTLATKNCPDVSQMAVDQDGRLSCETYGGCDGAETLLTHLIDLLMTLIGETLTLNLIRDVWPTVSFDTTTHTTP